MAASLGSLVVQLAADTARFQGDLGRAAHIAESRMRNIKDSATRALGAITVAATAAGTALAYAVKAAIDRADDMRDLAQGAGVSVEAMSRLAYAAKQTGTDVELVAKALGKLAKGGAADPQKALMQLADRFAALPDGAEKTALAYEIFGERIGAQLVPLLNEGSIGLARMADEADRLGITIGTDAAAAADEFNDRLGMLRGTVDGLANTLAAEMLPVLNAISQQFANAATSAETLDKVSRQLSTGFKLLIDLAYSVYKTFDDIGGALGALAAAAVAVAQGDFSRAAEIIRIANEDQLRSEAEANEFLRRLWEERAQDAERAAARIARSNLEAVSRGNDPVQNRVLTKYDPKGDKPLRDTAKEAAAEQARLASLYQSTAEAGIAAIRAQETEVERLTREYHEQRAALEALAITYPNMAEQAQAALQRLEVEGLEPIKITAERMFPEQERSLLQEYALEAARNMQDAWAQFFYDPMQDGFKGLLRGFVDMLRRMLAEWLATQTAMATSSFISNLFGAYGGGGGGSNIGLSEGQLSGAYAQIGALGTRAGGGPVMGGSAYLVGEKGPELFVPRTSGNIVANGGWGGVNVTYNVDARGATTDLVRALPAILQENNRRLLETMRDARSRGVTV